MGDIGFDRLVKALATTGARRQALRASIGGMLATAVTSLSQGQDAEAKKKKGKGKKKKKKKNQCMDFRESCTSNNECCGAEFGTVACRAHVNSASKSTCVSQFPGLRCCGLAPTTCNPGNGNCDCCDDLICALAANNEFRCQVDP